MHLVDKFLEVSEAKQWQFDYGTRSYQNLNEIVVDDDKIYFLCDPMVIDETRNENTNALEANTYTGGFLFCVKSNLDQKYMSEKFQQNIKPLKTILETMVRNSINACSEYTIKTWKLTEAINVFDMNVDGYIVQFEVKESFV